jgi:outer membrane protein
VKNNLSTVLNVVLLIAVAVLFYLHFTSRKDIADVKNNQAQDSVPKLSFNIPKNLAGARVLYINVDSISYNYDAFKDLYIAEGGDLEQQMQNYQIRAANFQRRYEQLNGKWPYSADSAMKEEAALAAEEKALMNLQNYLGTLQARAQEKNAIINQEVYKYFNQYSREKGIDYIIAVGAGSPIMYANDSLDVTQNVLEALNANYRASKQAPMGK